jgi:steroid delta-isomerase-like uncharacterized protein
MSRLRKTLIAAGAVALVALPAAAARLRRRLGRGGRMEDVKEIARRLVEDPWRGKLDEVIELVDDAYVAHTPGIAEPIRGKQGFREFVETYLTAFPDGAIVVDEQIAEGEQVASRWTARGTNTGELMGMPPTGKQVVVQGITITRIVNGTSVEAWISWDTLSMVQQLGLVPQFAPA